MIKHKPSAAAYFKIERYKTFTKHISIVLWGFISISWCVKEERLRGIVSGEWGQEKDVERMFCCLSREQGID